jgi:hypothetical protein
LGGAGATDRPQGAALAGEPFVNAHYARQLQGWMVQRAASGQFYSAPSNRLELRPPPAHGKTGARLPFFVPGKAAGTLVVGGGVTNIQHRLEVSLGQMPAGLTVVVEAAGRSVEVALGEATVGDAFLM